MKSYFRLLSFAKPIEKFAIPYILYTLLYVVLSSLVFPLLIPLLNTLFGDKSGASVHTAVNIKPTTLVDLSGWFKYYMNYFIQVHGAWGALQFVCITIIVTIFLGNLFRYLSARTMENLRIHTLLNMRRRVFDNVIDMHMGFFSNERKGDVISKIASDVQVVQYSVTATLQVVFRDPTQLIVFMVMLFVISVKLTLWSLLVVPVSAFIISRIVKRLKAQAIATQQSYGNMISYLDESLSGIKIIKAFNATDFIKKRFHDENRRYSKIMRSMAKRQQSASPVSEIMAVTMISFIVLYGGYLILNGRSDLNGGQFIAYIAIFSQIMRPAKSISDSFSNIHSGIAAGERVLALIDQKPLIVDAPNAIEIKEFNEGLHFNNVSFAYQDRVVLKNLSLTVP